MHVLLDMGTHTAMEMETSILSGSLSRYCQQALDTKSGGFSCMTFFAYLYGKEGVNPRGLEPLASAMRGRLGESRFVPVCWRNRLSYAVFSVFEATIFLSCSAPFCPGCSTVAVIHRGCTVD
jgi:hypothetical protein